jgi:hypothetical protein
MALSSSHGEPITMNSFRYLDKSTTMPLTRCCQHLVASKHCICTGHETHSLFRLSEGVPSSCQSNNSGRQHNASCRDCANQSVIMHRLEFNSKM